MKDIILSMRTSLWLLARIWCQYIVLFGVLGFLSLSCRTNQKFLSAEEQCKELFQKRVEVRHAQRSKKKTDLRLARVQVPGARKSLILTQHKPKQPVVVRLSDKVVMHIPLVLPAFQTKGNATVGQSEFVVKPQENSKGSDDNIQSLTKVPLPAYSGTNHIWNGNTLMLMAACAAMVGFLSLKLGQYRARKISEWAAANPWKARGVITGIKTTTTIAALAAGHHLYHAGIAFDLPVQLATLSFVLASAITYPNAFPKFIRPVHSSYLKRKAYDLAVFMSGAMLVTQLATTSKFNEAYDFATTNFSKQQSNYLLEPTPGAAMDVAQVHAQSQPAAGLSVGAKIALTILVVAVFVFFGYLVAALACSLSCGGAEAAATIVALGGAAALIFGLFKALKGIFKKPVPLYVAQEHADATEISKILQPKKIYRVELKNGEVIRMEFSKIEGGELFGLVGNHDIMHTIQIDEIARIWRR